MHGRELVEKMWFNDLQARLKQLGTQQQRVQPANNKHRERKPQIHCADVFVIGRVQPTAPAIRMVVVRILVVAATVAMLVEHCAHGFTPWNLLLYLLATTTCGTLFADGIVRLAGVICEAPQLLWAEPLCHQPCCPKHYA